MKLAIFSYQLIFSFIYAKFPSDFIRDRQFSGIVCIFNEAVAFGGDLITAKEKLWKTFLIFDRNAFELGAQDCLSKKAEGWPFFSSAFFLKACIQILCILGRRLTQGNENPRFVCDFLNMIWMCWWENASVKHRISRIQLSRFQIFRKARGLLKTLNYVAQ